MKPTGAAPFRLLTTRNTASRRSRSSVLFPCHWPGLPNRITWTSRKPQTACPTSSRRKNWTPTLPAWKPICARRQRNLSLKRPPSCATPFAICAQKSFCLLRGGNGVEVQAVTHRCKFFICAASVRTRKAGGLEGFRHAVPEFRFICEYDLDIQWFFVGLHKLFYARIGSAFGGQCRCLSQ